MKSIKLFFTLSLLTFLTFSCTPENEIDEDINQFEEQGIRRTEPRHSSKIDEDK